MPGCSALRVPAQPPAEPARAVLLWWPSLSSRLRLLDYLVDSCVPVAVVLAVSQLLNLVVRGFSNLNEFMNSLFSHVCRLVVVCISVVYMTARRMQ